MYPQWCLILNRAVMKSCPFSICVDGSNDNGLEKMNPLTVRFFNDKRGLVETQLLDMCQV